MTHELKILPMYFQAVWDGKKTFEVRKNDRGYKPNDIIVLKEWDGANYTGSAVVKRVGYMLTDTIDGIEKGYCVLGLKDYEVNRNENDWTMAEHIEKGAAIAAIMSEPPDAHYPDWYVEKIKAIPAAGERGSAESVKVCVTKRRCRKR